MKKYILITLLSIIGIASNAQKVIEKNLEYTNQYIVVDLKFASDIEVATWDKNQIYFKADISTKDGKFQDSYQLKMEETSNKISIVSKPEAVFKKFQEEWNNDNPDKKKRYYNTGDWYNFTYTLYVPKNAIFKISSINGDLTSDSIEGEFTADLINGNITIKAYAGTLDLTTINGEIDLRMDNASILAETIHGDIYADKKLQFSFKDRHVGQKISGIVAEGKNTLLLNTINGNMYLRY